LRRDPRRLGEHAAQHGGEELGGGQLPLTEQDRAVVDAALRVGLERLGAGPGGVQRLPPDQQLLAVDEDRRGEQRHAVEQQRPHPPVGPAQHGDRVGGAEVDAEPVSVGDHR
jgi:hypothetical protein